MRTRCALMAPLCQNAASFSCPPALGVRSVIPLEVGRGGAGMGIILPGRDEEMEVRLLARSVQRRRIMKGIGDGQPGPGDGIHEVPHQCHDFVGARVRAAA